ncbi:MAG TPA: LysR family transcriptional regulator [Symbiobacteriaceae bacterium]|jgi:DNA-binding transcriptional LysR family regulator
MVGTDVNLHYLRIFHAVAEAGNVTRAAERLRISQPAVSAQLKRLEAELGVPLLEPRGRGVRLTEAGDALAGHARRLFALEREIESDLARRRDGRAGSLRIGATNLPGHFLLPRWVSAFKQQLPGVDVHIRTNNSRTIFDCLHEYAVDVALMAGGWEEPGIAREVVLEDELWFVVAAGHRLCGQTVTLAELAREPFVVREAGSSTRMRLFALFEMHGLAPVVGLVFAGLQETARAVEGGYGVALLPTLSVREQVAAGRLGRVQVSGVHLPFPVLLCTRQGEAATPAVRIFVDLVRTACRGLGRERGRPEGATLL